MDTSSDRAQNQRVLVISNNCFSVSSSNGRTLSDLFIGWPTANLAQFHVIPGIPNESVCSRYLCVTDTTALKSVFFRRAQSGRGSEPSRGRRTPGRRERPIRRIAKTPTTALARHAVWKFGAWEKQGFASWVDAFDPELIFLLAGDTPFLFNLARRLAATRRIPLVIMSTEDYYFKTENYMSDGIGLLSSVSYRLFAHILRRDAASAFSNAALCICNGDDLRVVHEEAFGVRAVTVMPPTTVRPRTTVSVGTSPSFSYLGNLGHGRHEALMDIGTALQRIDDRLTLDVYGHAPSEHILADLAAAPGIRYQGILPYDEVVAVMHASDVLIHAESFADKDRSQIRYAFSTKLADYLASGTCALVYAPEELWLTRYLVETEAALVVSDISRLEAALRSVISSETLRLEYASKGLGVAEERHSLTRNIARFQTILKELS